MMIVSASGMLTGGRIVHHLRRPHRRPQGACCSSSATRARARSGRTSRPARSRSASTAQWRDVRCEIRSISGFSAHADESELVDWLGHFATGARRPRTIFIVHGDPDAELAVEARVKGLGLAAHRPAWREEVDLG